VRTSSLDPATLARPHGVGVRVSSIYGDVVVDGVPVVSGELSASEGQRVPERLTLQVPVRDRGQVWEPVSPTDPLNAFGQILEVTYLVKRAGGLADVEVPLGQFRIQAWDAGRDVVNVDAVGLLQIVEDARLTVPSSPAAGMTYVQAVEFLVEGLLPLEFDGVTDSSIAQVVQWDDDRLGAILDLLDTWGARAYVDSGGVLTVAPVPDFDGPAVVAWRDGAAGTVVSAPRAGSRDGVYNAVVVSSSASDLSDYQQTIAQATAYDRSSAVRWDGPYGHVPYFHSSPLIRTAAEAERTAATILQRVTRFAATREVTAIPDPRVELGDIASVVTVEAGGVTSLTGEVLGYRLPLTAAQGPASYTVSAMGSQSVEGG
jgi:hypothetical protein